MTAIKLFFLLLFLSVISSCGDSTSAEQTFFKSIQKKWNWVRTSHGDVLLIVVTPDSIHTHFKLDLTTEHSIKLLRNDTLQFSGHYQLSYKADQLISDQKQWCMTLDSSEVASYPLSPPLAMSHEYVVRLTSNELLIESPSQYDDNAEFIQN